MGNWKMVNYIEDELIPPSLCTSVLLLNVVLKFNCGFKFLPLE